MMKATILVFVLLVFSLSLYSQKTAPSPQSPPKSDELLKHLSAAETFQISGDLANAAVENKAVIGIALQRIGNIAIEEGKFEEAAKILSDSLLFADNAANRTNLAVAFLRRNELEKAADEGRKAVALDPEFLYGHYILGNIYFTKGDYNSALPHLEKVFRMSPNFEVANALGLTYLYLKQVERAKLLFEEVLIAAKDKTPELHLLFAQNYQKTNFPLEAERELKRVLAINPRHTQANFFLGYLILQQGGSDRLSEAGAAFEANLQITPEDFNSNFFAGIVATSENKHEKAVKFLQKALQLDPQKAEAYVFLGQSQIELNDFVNAEKSLRQGIVVLGDQDPQSHRTHFMLGRLLIRAGRKEEGENELKISRQLQEKNFQSDRDEISQILGKTVKENNKKENPNTVKVNLSAEKAAEFKKFTAYLNEVLAQAYHNLGVIAVQTGQTEDALANFETAAKWKSDFPGLDRNWGIVSFRSAQFEKALTPLSRHLKNNPGDNLVRRMLGVSYYFTRDYAKTIEILKPLETSVLADAELAYFYGISLIQSKQEEGAAQIFAKLAEAAQNNPETLSYAAQGFMMLGNYERAVKEFRQVVSLNPVLPKANYFIGQSLIRLNRFEEAEKSFNRELEVNPGDFLAKYHLALTLIERKIEPEKTISLLEEALSLKYDYADARYQLGKIYLEKGQTAKAIEQLEIAVKTDDKKDYIHYQLSIAYRKAERKDEAERELKRYQELKSASRKNDAPMGNNDNNPQ